VDATSTINPLGYIDACGTRVNEGTEVDGQSDPLGAAPEMVVGPPGIAPTRGGPNHRRLRRFNEQGW